MNDKEINDLSHELFAIVSGSLGNPDCNIEDTVKIMNEAIQEALKEPKTLQVSITDEIDYETGMYK